MQEMVRIVLHSLECRTDPEAAGAALPSEEDFLHDKGLTATVGCPLHYATHAAVAASAKEDAQPATDPYGSSGGAQRSGEGERLKMPVPCAAALSYQAAYGDTLTGDAAEGARPLSWDSCQQIIALAAYPISAWL